MTIAKTPIVAGLFWILVLSSGTSLGQGGGFGGGMMDPFDNTHHQLNVVIMLGDDYDYQTRPFASAQDVVDAYRTGENGVVVMGRPQMSNVSVDVSTPIPKESVRMVVAEYESTEDVAEIEKFKKSIKLNALRFGINRVEFIEKKKLSPGDPHVWLREPYFSQTQFAADAKLLHQIAGELIGRDEDGGTRLARLDLYHIPRRSSNANGSTMEMDMEMGGMDDMGMDDMSMGGGMGMSSPSELTAKVETNAKQRSVYEKRIKALVSEMKQMPEQKDELRMQLAEIVRADLNLKQANQQIEIQRLQIKVNELSLRMGKKWSTFDSEVMQRVAELTSE